MTNYLEKLEEMKRDDNKHPPGRNNYQSGYNQALEDVKPLLEEAVREAEKKCEHCYCQKVMLTSNQCWSTTEVTMIPHMQCHKCGELQTLNPPQND